MRVGLELPRVLKQFDIATDVARAFLFGADEYYGFCHLTSVEDRFAMKTHEQ